jgi:hypothetical protein
LGLGPAGAGIDADEDVAYIVLVTEHPSQLQGLEPPFAFLQPSLRLHGLSAIIDRGDLQENLYLLQFSGNTLVGTDHPLNACFFAQQFLCRKRIVPEPLGTLFCFDLGYAIFLVSEVKDTPGWFLGDLADHDKLFLIPQACSFPINNSQFPQRVTIQPLTIFCNMHSLLYFQ